MSTANGSSRVRVFVVVLGTMISTIACSLSSNVAATCLESAAPAVWISEFYACGTMDDEYVTICSEADHDVDLTGWSLTDGEGWLVFRENAILRRGDRMSISFNSSSYSSAFGRPPDFQVDLSGENAMVDVVGSFRLADDGDSIALIDSSGLEVDFVLFGDVESISETWNGPALLAPRQGEVMRRIPSCEDTDTAADWHHFREFRYGYTEHLPVTSLVGPGNLTAFVSPDCSLDTVLDWIAAASDSIRLCAYEISSSSVFEALVNALDRGVDVHILVEGTPVGGISQKEVAILSGLSVAGAKVTALSGNLREGIVKHVFAMHSKYVVIDSDRLIVLSENFVEDGLPIDRVFGNRGWGIAARDGELARYMKSVFDGDVRQGRPDAIDWESDERFDSSIVVAREPISSHTEGILLPFVTRLPAEVTLHVSPDCSVAVPFLCDVMEASHEICVEQLQVDLLWSTRWSETNALSPLLGKVIDGLRAGGSCRMLLDSSWFNLDGNGRVASTLTAIASVESLDGTFEMMNERSPITVMHNKGMLADGSMALISSNNWAYASFARNRELAAVVRSNEIAEYLLTAFELDWHPDTTAPVVETLLEVSALCGDWVTLSSECFRDDRLLVDCFWDVGCDGTIDGGTREFHLLVTVPGTIEVSLTVADSWGNEATTVIIIRVFGPSTGTLPESQQPWWPGAIIVPGSAAMGYAAFRFARLNRARKPP
ncbi:MAG: phospholipase D-like domain-containing protein [Thermoplasmata archaeon]|nr:phospholipase D-like domain-containing protein [Thermoplasmata archaeon]